MLKILLEKDDYEKAISSSQNMWCSSKQSFYGRGLLNTKDDPYKTERTGKLGEIALSKILNVEPDLSYRKHGDKSDFYINNKHIDIKTAARFPKYQAGLIYALNEFGKPVKIKSDIYVFGYIENDDLSNKIANIVLLGFQLKENIIQLPMVPAKYGKHLNYEIKYDTLIDIDKLLTYLME